MNNTLLEKLFEKYNVSPKNRYEITQIFYLLDAEKQKNLINNFEILVVKLEKIENQIEIEKNLLIPEAIDNIKQVLERVRKQRLENDVKWKIDFLKQEV